MTKHPTPEEAAISLADKMTTHREFVDSIEEVRDLRQFRRLVVRLVSDLCEEQREAALREGAEKMREAAAMLFDVREEDMGRPIEMDRAYSWVRRLDVDEVLSDDKDGDE